MLNKCKFQCSLKQILLSHWYAVYLFSEIIVHFSFKELHGISKRFLSEEQWSTEYWELIFPPMYLCLYLCKYVTECMRRSVASVHLDLFRLHEQLMVSADGTSHRKGKSEMAHRSDNKPLLGCLLITRTVFALVFHEYNKKICVIKESEAKHFCTPSGCSKWNKMVNSAWLRYLPGSWMFPMVPGSTHFF